MGEGSTKFGDRVKLRTVPPELVVNAVSEDGEIMGVRHATHPVHGVQFHPESVLTRFGYRMLARFLGAPDSAVSALPGAADGGTAGDAEGGPGHAERREVGQHVPGVGDQRQRAGDEAAHDLGHHEPARQQRRDPDGPGARRIARRLGAMMVAAVVVVAVRHRRTSRRRTIAPLTRASKSCGSRTPATSAASTVTPQRSAIAW